MADFLISYRGTLQTDVEQFTHTITANASNDLTTSEDVSPRAVDALTALLDTDTLRTQFPTSTRWTEVRVAKILDKALGTLEPAHVTPLDATFAGSATTSILPPQCSVVVSLTAGRRPNGSVLRGRFYLPPMITNVIDNNSALLKTVIQGNVLNAAREMILAIDTAIGPELQATVWSRAGAVLQNIESVRVGRVIDTVRRRRSAIPEEYVEHVF